MRLGLHLKTTRIVRGEELSMEEVKKSKKLVDRVLHEILNLDDASDMTLTQVLQSCGISDEEYENALDTMQRSTTIHYKRNLDETHIVPYNTVLLSLLKANMNIQFVSGTYGLLTYVAGYMCKDDKNMSELMKKASKEADSEGIRNKLKSIGNVFLKNREVGMHEATKRLLSGPFRRSNIFTLYIPTGPQDQRVRMLKPKSLLDQMDPDDTNIFATNIIEKYENRPDILEDMSYADFATSYISQNVQEIPDEDDLRNYTNPVNMDIEYTEVLPQIITLKNNMGKMRKRKQCVMRYHKPSKFSLPENYYMVLLQLYMPWRHEDEIIGHFDNYEDKFNHVYDEIEENIFQHEPFFGQLDIDEMDLEDNPHFMDTMESSDDDNDGNISDDNEYSAFDPSLLDLDSGFEDDDIATGATASSSIENPSIPLDTFYEMCEQLNESQRELFNYIMKWAMKYKLHNDNDELEPDPFHIFLTGGAGVGKSFLLKVIAEYLRKTLVFPGQNSDEQPSIAITASTGKAACNVEGTTVHSAFKLPRHGENAIPKSELRGKELQTLQMKYAHLKVLIIDEISMVGRLTWDDLNKFLRQIKNNDKADFGGVSVLVIGDFFQLPPVKQSAIFEKPTLTDAWYLFQLHELTEIVRQNGDPEFAALLNRMREGNETQADIQFVQSLSDTDTGDWPADHCKLYITNKLKDNENETHLKRLQEEGNELHTIMAKDSKKDTGTNLHTIKVKPDAAISETGNLPYCLKICNGSRVMLTDNADVSDHLINGSIGTVVKIHRRQDSTSPIGVIFVRFDDPVAGNKRKSNRLRAELKDCVPIESCTKEFNVSRHKKNNP